MSATTHYAEIPPFITKDGSEIRELMHPQAHGNQQQRLAEARVPPGGETLLHRHRHAEELYHITAGRGLMTLAERTFEVAAGDTVHIPPRTAHRIRNIGDDTLCLLCCCAPPYRHEDTELLD